MLRINLLPPYIYDKQKKIKWIVASGLLIAATAFALIMAIGAAEKARQDALAAKSEADTQKAAYDKIVQDINNENAKIAETKAKQEFVASAIKYNEAWPQVYTEMRDLTSPRVLLKSMYVGDDRKTINFTGFCQYEEDLVRWWMFLRSQPMFTNVHFQLPPHPFPPAGDNTAGGGAGMMGAGMGRPRMGGISGAGGSGGPMASGMSGPGMGGGSFGGGGTPRASGISGAGGPMSGGPMGGGMGGPGMGGGSFGGGGGNTGSVGPEEIDGRKGIAFTAFAQLKQALAGGIPTPSWGTAPAAGAGGPGFGGPPAGGSGMMGSMGGSMGGGAGAPGRGKGAAD